MHHKQGDQRPNKNAFYATLGKFYRSSKDNGLNYIIGDYNARVQCALNKDESEAIGPHTFETITADPLARSEEVIENRQLFMDLYNMYDLIAVNQHLVPKNRRQTGNIPRDRCTQEKG